MTLATFPAAVITRLRAECTLFSNRVAAAASIERAAEQTSLALPHGFFIMGSLEPEDAEISPLDQMVALKFRVAFVVDNSADARGQSGVIAAMAATAAITAALIGWTPDGTVFAPILFEGADEPGDDDRARLWGELSFRTALMTSAF